MGDEREQKVTVCSVMCFQNKPFHRFIGTHGVIMAGKDTLDTLC